MREAGIAVPDDVLVTSRDAFDAALANVGYPLVMKIQSPDIAHKSEVGGVEVGIADHAQAVAAYERLLASVREHRPNATLRGVLVCPMARKGVEIILGTLVGPTFGPVLMVGLGGVTTELFRDVVYRPAPVSEDEARAMIDELKAAPLLNGYRGAKPADTGALAALMAKLSALAAANTHCIAEFEINPVLVHADGEGVTIVDALAVPRAD